MIDILHSVILGVIEGVTEFLPISSTAHLILTSRMLGIAQTDYAKFYEVFIQSGAILAVVVLYFGYIRKHVSLWTPIVLSFIPTAIVGFLLQKIIKTIFFNSYGLIAGALIVFGIAFIIVERMIKQNKLDLKKEINSLTNQEALLIGLAQSLAVVPGVSRAGIVILTMMIMRYKRRDAALYSFLLAIPTVIAASALDLFKSRALLAHSGNNIASLAVGFIVSFAVAYATVRWLIEYLRSHTLAPFGYYRIVLAIIVGLTLVF